MKLPFYLIALPGFCLALWFFYFLPNKFPNMFGDQNNYALRGPGNSSFSEGKKNAGTTVQVQGKLTPDANWARAHRSKAKVVVKAHTMKTSEEGKVAGEEVARTDLAADNTFTLEVSNDEDLMISADSDEDDGDDEDSLRTMLGKLSSSGDLVSFQFTDQTKKRIALNEVTTTATKLYAKILSLTNGQQLWENQRLLLDEVNRAAIDIYSQQQQQSAMYSIPNLDTSHSPLSNGVAISTTAMTTASDENIAIESGEESAPVPEGETALSTGTGEESDASEPTVVQEKKAVIKNGSKQGDCVISLNRCRNYPDRVGSFKITLEKEEHFQASCLAQSWEIHRWCGNGIEDSVQAELILNNEVRASNSTRSGCFIEEATCSEHPEAVGTFIDSEVLAHSDKTVCLRRSAVYARWCGNHSDDVTTAIFVRDGQVKASRDTRQGCFITLDSCNKNPKLPSSLVVFEDDADIDGKNCLIQARKIHSFCGNSRDQNVSASFVAQNGTELASTTYSAPDQEIANESSSQATNNAVASAGDTSSANQNNSQKEKSAQVESPATPSPNNSTNASTNATAPTSDNKGQGAQKSENNDPLQTSIDTAAAKIVAKVVEDQKPSEEKSSSKSNGKK
jgi:hypothetical protein